MKGGQLGRGSKGKAPQQPPPVRCTPCWLPSRQLIKLFGIPTRTQDPANF